MQNHIPFRINRALTHFKYLCYRHRQGRHLHFLADWLVRGHLNEFTTQRAIMRNKAVMNVPDVLLVFPVHTHNCIWYQLWRGMTDSLVTLSRCMMLLLRFGPSATRLNHLLGVLPRSPFPPTTVVTKGTFLSGNANISSSLKNLHSEIHASLKVCFLVFPASWPVRMYPQVHRTKESVVHSTKII